MNLESLHKVWEIKVLKKPGEDDARKILDRISKQVQPIMRRRKWRVKLLSEFSPTNPSLLGLNVGAGSEVKLRLRRPNRDWDFFPFEQVLDTMLHELCHIEHGPHNALFYKLWDELRKECDDLIAKGITGTGEGFDGTGRRLGGFTRQPPPSSLRQTALAAAQKRARVGALLPSGPRRLGGDDVIMCALSPIQAAAMAAERRMQDDLWCGSVSREIEMIDGLEELGESSNSSSCHRSTPLSLSTSSISAIENKDDKLLWECKVCTLLNQPLAPICEACEAQKPRPLESKHKTWSCKLCTLENSIKLDKCSICEQWRYSYGPPASTRGPNYGT
ncbi:DNA-dependent metalloprotease WSS1 isoform X2 [Phalaenopsis equestris]|uniref:DNA-dependent metalloprotease WSS1 isoform X2 n=1 Tax=Phalaenopsis equestris TaxID=78828 RepID=UPI0009E1E6D4|nr:DNA-dependent metalloprotease WSS1 isoform X2 [Phalaenopsis equestris]